MAISELFYDNRPEVLFNPRTSQRVDPRFTYTRASEANVVNRDGDIVTVPANALRLAFDPVTRKPLGYLNEPSKTNLAQNSSLISTINGNGPDGWLGFNPGAWLQSTTLAPDKESFFLFHGALKNTGGGIRIEPTGLTPGGKYTFSVYAKKLSAAEVAYFAANNLADNGANMPQATYNNTSSDWFASEGIRLTAKPELGIGDEFSSNVGIALEPNRFFLEFEADSAGSIQIVFSVNFGNTTGESEDQGALALFWGAQLEPERMTSLINTPIGTTATRAADLLSINKQLAETGSVFVDAQAIYSNENDTLVSLKNSSNQKVNLSYISNNSTYNSLALLASYSGNNASSLPLPVPSTSRERNLITYGAQNYQYGQQSSRFATSLSSSVPTNLNTMSIGHDAAIPSNGFHGYINAVYLWNGEISPAVAAALVRGDVDPINADTYSPSGPAGSLSLIINTQGTATDAEKTFTFPAQSDSGTANDIVITWGDSTESGLDATDADLGAIGLTHTYSAAGIYPVFVSGDNLENIKYNDISNAPDLVEITNWGTGNIYTNPTSMNGAFYGCSQMNLSASARSNLNLPDTSLVTDWANAFRSCAGITGTFPDFDFSAATTFSSAFRDCSGLTAFTSDTASKNLETQNITDFSFAWDGCSSMASFPLLNTTSATNLENSFANCQSLVSFPIISTSGVTNFRKTWLNCISLTSFPSLDLSAGTTFNESWKDCSSLTSFPSNVNTGSGTNFSYAWSGCSALASFPLLDFSNGVNFRSAFEDTSSLVSFPSINTSLGEEFASCWEGCNSLTGTFPNTGFQSARILTRAWQGCDQLTGFPQINLQSCTALSRAWRYCSGLTSFPAILNTGLVTTMFETWNGCFGLTSFPLIAVDSVTNFNRCWSGCTALANFPAGFFNSWAGTPVEGCFYETWKDCNVLTSTSVVNILDSINFSGVAAPSGTGTEITIDMDPAGVATVTSSAASAITAIKGRGWSIVLNGTTL